MSQSEYICSGLYDLEVKLEKSLAPIRFGDCWFWTLTLAIDLSSSLLIACRNNMNIDMVVLES
jgi:hypothetical protein